MSWLEDGMFPCPQIIRVILSTTREIPTASKKKKHNNFRCQKRTFIIHQTVSTVGDLHDNWRGQCLIKVLQLAWPATIYCEMFKCVPTAQARAKCETRSWAPALLWESSQKVQTLHFLTTCRDWHKKEHRRENIAMTRFYGEGFWCCWIPRPKVYSNEVKRDSLKI